MSKQTVFNKYLSNEKKKIICNKKWLSNRLHNQIRKILIIKEAIFFFDFISPLLYLNLERSSKKCGKNCEYYDKVDDFR